MEVLDESLSVYLSSFGKDMHDGRFPALVTGVTEKEARVIVMTTRDPDEPGLVRGVIPFSLADWAYPPRNSDGIRPPPLTKMTNALNRNDVIMVQRLMMCLIALPACCGRRAAFPIMRTMSGHLARSPRCRVR